MHCLAFSVCWAASGLGQPDGRVHPLQMNLGPGVSDFVRFFWLQIQTLDSFGFGLALEKCRRVGSLEGGALTKETSQRFENISKECNNRVDGFSSG